MIKFSSGDRPSFATERGFRAESVQQYCLISSNAKDGGDDVILAYERGADAGKSGRQIENPYAAETAQAKAFEQGYVDGEKIGRRLAAGNITPDPD